MEYKKDRVGLARYDPVVVDAWERYQSTGNTDELLDIIRKCLHIMSPRFVQLLYVMALEFALR